jgi:cell division protein FtsW (lipid II flippase)
MIALMVIGVLAIRTAEEAIAIRSVGDPGAHRPDFSKKQAMFAVVAVVAFIVATVVPYQRVGRLAYPLFALTLGLLVLVLFLPAIQHSRRWIALGPLRVQPSEIAKVSYVALLAWYLRYRDNYRRLLGLIVPFVLTLVPLVLILKEPDLGTSLLFLPTLYFMLFMAGARLVHLLGIVAVTTVLIFLPVPVRIAPTTDSEMATEHRAIAYWTFKRGDKEYAALAAPLAIIRVHQLKRIDGWIRQGDARLSLERGLQLRMSKTALGAGAVAGAGDWEDVKMFLSRLPASQTDFIFSIVAGQWGFLGCLGVLALYGVIFAFGLEIAVVTHDPFGRLLAVGTLMLLLSQLFINVGMTMGLMPITGMTLPLVSYGGSSLVVNCAALGLLVNVGMRRPISLAKRPFEHGPKREKPLAVRTMFRADGR